VLFATAETVIGWLLLRQAVVADAKKAGAPEHERLFYEGKLAAVRWYARNVLPGVGFARKSVEAGTLELMELSNDVF
jgi:hypothetical protein